MSDWREKLLAWYQSHKRDLPWRNISDPYKIWLSEVILQQTRVNQGWEYYLRFIEKYPAIGDLATASQQDILKLWQGLGYYSRARNLHEAAQYIMKEHKGVFPQEYHAIKALKGVGEYTAGAIASIAYGLPFPAVDGNVMRVYTRLFGITTPIDSIKGRKEIKELANELLPHHIPGIYNQAVMELGAMVCLPAKPDCANCPVQVACYAFAHKKMQDFPVKQGKVKQRNRYLNYLVITHAGKMIIRLRGAGDIWQGLHDFPVIESTKSLTPNKFLKNREWEKIMPGVNAVIKDVSDEYVHILSHQKLYARFYLLTIDKKAANVPLNCFWVKTVEVENYAVPKLIDLYIRKKIMK